jgi:CHASE2 domain-containing sensor protein
MPIIFSNEYFFSFRQALSDFDVTDVGIAVSREESQVLADPNIVIVNIDDLTNSNLINALDLIIQFNPKVIGVNKTVVSNNNLEEDSLLTVVLKRFKNIVFASDLSNFNQNFGEYESINRGMYQISKYTQTGYRNLFFGKDKTINTLRTFHPKTNIMGVKEKAFAVRIAELFDKSKVEYLLNRNYDEEIIYYHGNFNKYFNIDYKDLMKGDFDPEFFQNKIVLIGKLLFLEKFNFLEDMYFTPISGNSKGRGFPDMYETEIHANILTMITQSKYYYQIPLWIVYLFAFLITYINFILFFWISERFPMWYEVISNITFLIESIGILILTINLYNKTFIHINLTPVLFAVAITIIIFEAYKDSLLPFVRKFYFKIFRRGSI